jgi:hypothetical protein
MPRRRLLAALAVLTASALYVGAWAALGPRSFYDSFPGFHRVWVGVDGPFNEHLVRDVGGLYLALAVAGAVAAYRLDRSALLVVGSGWTVFGTSHLGYHLHHLGELAVVDAVGNVVALGGTLGLALLVLRHGVAPSRRTTDGPG